MAVAAVVGVNMVMVACARTNGEPRGVRGDWDETDRTAAVVVMVILVFRLSPW